MNIMYVYHLHAWYPFQQLDGVSKSCSNIPRNEVITKLNLNARKTRTTQKMVEYFRRKFNYAMCFL